MRLTPARSLPVSGASPSSGWSRWTDSKAPSEWPASIRPLRQRIRSTESSSLTGRTSRRKYQPWVTLCPWLVNSSDLVDNYFFTLGIWNDVDLFIWVAYSWRTFRWYFPKRLHSTKEAFLLRTQQPWVQIPTLPRFFLFSWWPVLRSNPSSANQPVSQMQLAVTSKAKY